MKKEYDFASRKRGAVKKNNGKTRITIYLDDEILDAFKARAIKEQRGYQTIINETLKAAIGSERSMDAQTIRRIIREELANTVS
jgi:uncharacterized protein (DUF4415 family)